MTEELKPLEVAPVSETLISGDLGYNEDGAKILNVNETQELIDQGTSVVTSPIDFAEAATVPVVASVTCGKCHKPKSMVLKAHGEPGQEMEIEVNKKNASSFDNAKDLICLCGRPTVYTNDEEMCAKADEYLKLNADEYKVVKRPFIDKEGNEKTAADIFYEVNLPSHEGFALMLDVAPTTLYEWAEKYPMFSKALGKIKEVQKQRLVNNGLSERYNATIAKLILSSNHGMREKSDVTTDDKPIEGIAVSFVKPKQDA